ncbi:SpaA isopeptide-forming pilin-related protein [Bifidobacterium angulatum]|uniref:SpaA isopeptide-forming pilin-related protein n=1 Tax=Bifidobacterium angulatum TaxID=1683 RepID=UPI000B0CFDBB|nr:SpaA isopeptide-forming pilin-related protein [Bifidobacterium angulatum]
MKTRTWMAGIAAVATLFAAMTAPAGAMAEESDVPGASQSAKCETAGNIITVKGEDADAFRTWSGKTPLGNRTFSVVKVADYKIDNGESGGLVHLETVNGSKPDIIQAVKDLSANAGKSLYENEDHDGDPMNWLANTKNDMLIRRYAEHPGVTGSALAAEQVKVDDTNNTMTLTMPNPGLYVIFDATQPKQQTKDTGDTTVEYAGFSNMLVGTPLADDCKVTNNDGVVDLTSSNLKAKTGSATTERGGFKFTKVGVESDRSGLSGAEFTVYSDKDFTQVLKDAKGNVVKATSSENGGLVDFEGFKLNAGTYYLKETVVPAGYWSGSAAKLMVTMTKNDQGKIELESITDMSSPASGLLSHSVQYGYVYRNIKSITQLPLTGAMGMAILGVVAVLCIGGASIIIVRARKTKRSFVA